MTEHYDQREDVYNAQKVENGGKKGNSISMNDQDYTLYNALMLRRSRLMTKIADLNYYLELVEKRLNELSEKKTPD